MAVPERTKVNKINAKILKFASKGVNEATEIWWAELIYGWNPISLRASYVVKLINKFDSQEVCFSYKDFSNPKMIDNILDSMREIAIAKPGYVKYFNLYVDELMREKEYTKVDDLSNYLPYSFNGLNALQYIEVITQYYAENPHLIPLRSSRLYNDDCDGVILDGELSDEETTVVAIVSGRLRDLISKGNDNMYRDILEGLVQVGVLEGNSGTNDNDASSDKRKEKRLDKVKTLAPGVNKKCFILHLSTSQLKKGVSK